MHNKLILESFSKAQEKTGSDQRQKNARELSNFISTLTENGLGEDRLAQLHRAAKNSEGIVLRTEIEQALLEYLGFDNMDDFRRAQHEDPITKTLLKELWSKCWFKFFVYHLVLLIIASSVYVSATRQCWMVWEGDRYVQVDFDNGKYGTRLKICKKERLKNFRQIKAECGVTEFFNLEGNPKIWYGKNRNGDLEYFTDLGLHPETGKTLKPITQYMINTHICN
ncbi:hypothetical protein [Gilvibacter sediminis]|uniref:hypothetical protein n=1 Tax=Gilvibacter sediminis TaxID=379071 RepID=UPI00234FC727|nr:hypothetical protein [Gilvibacter sediminis]MDC7997041.1 hypothetical protein [Gilvibacter sediminis]